MRARAEYLLVDSRLKRLVAKSAYWNFALGTKKIGKRIVHPAHGILPANLLNYI